MVSPYNGFLCQRRVSRRQTQHQRWTDLTTPTGTYTLKRYSTFFFSFRSEIFLRKDALLQLSYPKPHNNNHHCSLPRGSQVAQVVKNPPANAGDARDMDSIPGSGRSPGEGNSNPLQYPCLGNPMGREIW